MGGKTIRETTFIATVRKQPGYNGGTGKVQSKKLLPFISKEVQIKVQATTGRKK